MTARARHAATADPTHYPVSDDMGEGVLHMRIRDELRRLLERFLATRDEHAFVGSDQFIYWVQFNPTKVLAPDVYVLPGVAPDACEDVWKVWDTGVVPSFALEVVSRDYQKDYYEVPRSYEELGIPELVVFDPEFAHGGERTRWRLHRRDRRGVLAVVEATNRDRIRSRALGCFLRAVGDGASTRLRIATGSRGDTLFPTEAEELDRLRAENAKLRRR